MSLKEFLEGYVACMFTVDDGMDTEECLPSGLSFEDLDANDQEKIQNDCQKFYTENICGLRQVVAEFDADWNSLGHHFKLNRDGQGSGFWDQGYGPTGDKLSTAASKFGTDDILCGYWIPREED